MVIFCVISILVLRDPKHSKKTNTTEQADGQVDKIGPTRVVENKTIMKICVGITGVGLATVAFTDYLAIYLEIEQGFSKGIVLLVGRFLIIFINNYGVLAGALLLGVGSVGYYVYYSMLPLDVSKSAPSFVDSALALILACGWIPSLFVPMIFQAALDRGISMQIVTAIFAIPTLVSVFIQMFIGETGPKAKQMQAEDVTHLSS